MAYTTVNKGSAHYNSALYSGNGTGTNAVTGLGFQPDLVCIKRRNSGTDWQIHDSVRGKSGSNYQYIQFNNSNAQSVQGDSDGINTFGADGFTAGYTNSAAWNESGGDFVGMCWKGNGAGVSNSDGTVTTTVSANATAGFSIVKYDGPGSGGATIGHGLGVKPKCIIVKSSSAAENWTYWIDTAGQGTAGIRMILNSGNGDYGNYMPTFNTDTITLPSHNDGGWSGSGKEYIAYCFAEKPGHSAFGEYKGNGQADGQFIWTGFKPKFVICKAHNTTEDWGLWGYYPASNQIDRFLYANASTAESTGIAPGDLLANGFKLRTTDGKFNSSSNSYIYMAWGQTMVGTNNIPATAR